MFMFGFGFGQLFYILLLLVNSLAILNEERFLAPIGWAAHTEPVGYGAEQGGGSVKGKLINLISAVRTLLRIPLVGVNVVVIVYELLLG